MTPLHCWSCKSTEIGSFDPEWCQLIRRFKWIRISFLLNSVVSFLQALTRWAGSTYGKENCFRGQKGASAISPDMPFSASDTLKLQKFRWFVNRRVNCLKLTNECVTRRFWKSTQKLPLLASHIRDRQSFQTQVHQITSWASCMQYGIFITLLIISSAFYYWALEVRLTDWRHWLDSGTSEWLSGPIRLLERPRW